MFDNAGNNFQSMEEIAFWLLAIRSPIVTLFFFNSVKYCFFCSSVTINSVSIIYLYMPDLYATRVTPMIGRPFDLNSFWVCYLWCYSNQVKKFSYRTSDLRLQVQDIFIRYPCFLLYIDIKVK